VRNLLHASRVGGGATHSSRITALLVVCLVAPTAAQHLGTARDGQLNGLLDSLRAAYALPALAAMSIHGDSVLEMAAAGVRATGFPERVRTIDRWHLGSLTKAMTATLAAMLVERGVLSWTTSVQDVFPQLVDSIRPGFRDVQIDELLSHRRAYLLRTAARRLGRAYVATRSRSLSNVGAGRPSFSGSRRATAVPTTMRTGTTWLPAR
jgi:CubicO group peptidase (beta-lactamase class C family)